jgi:hypothetical protein
VGLGEVGAQLDGPPKTGRGAGRVALLGQGNAQTVVAGGPTRLQPQRFPVTGQGVGGSARTLTHLAESVPHLGLGRVGLEGLPEGLLGPPQVAGPVVLLAGFD